ncbi:MAG TPA: glycosyltransferase family 39 protein [Steroidobacteraceae bacterium]|nr:glycosyltransferase family 39 protein [Steroidobacteraceae bacterium]
MSNPSHTNPLSRASRALWIAVAAAIAARLFLLVAFPLLDPTESRYAEIARQMFAAGDWVTPWIAPGEPFWGKPPLAFWMTAGSFQLLGVSDFAARLPHLFGGLLVAWMTWDWLSLRSRREAALAVALLAGSLLFFVSAGAVMTDMALAIGLMAVMRGYWLALHGQQTHRGREQILMFAGFAVGLLAKGPIALMAVVPIVVHAWQSRQLARVWGEIRWALGGLAVLACVLPWYLAAEARTPGFLQYFIVGEHWQRFVDSGWQGDLYGHAHAFPRGTIWLFAMLAFLPWSVVMPVIAWKQRRSGGLVAPADRELNRYLWTWALVPCAVFTLSGNVLWTYVLPAIPALAILSALFLGRSAASTSPERTVAAGAVFTAVATTAVVAAFNLGGWDDHRSMKSLVAEYRSVTRGEPLVFFRQVPYSASFYSGGVAEVAREPGDLEARLAEGPAYVVVRARHRARLTEALALELHLMRQVDEYALYAGGKPAGQASRFAAKRASAASASR